MHVHLPHVADMSDDRQSMRVGQLGHLDIFGDAGEPGHVRLDVLDCRRIDEATEDVRSIELLA